MTPGAGYDQLDVNGTVNLGGARLSCMSIRSPAWKIASASVQVTSDNHLPLVVERTMFWDASYYGGHTANAIAQHETRWIFAEGFQGVFDTYIIRRRPRRTSRSPICARAARRS